MSSNSLPDLELELRTPWGLLASLIIWLFALVISLWRVDGLPRGSLPIAAALLALALIGLSQVASGVAPAAPKRVVWSGDGAWRLRDGRGREWSATLDSRSRRWGHVTLLVWRAQTRCWWVILTPVTVGRDEYRRLSVRLRLDRHA